MIHRFMIPFPQPAFLSGRVGLDPRPQRLDNGRRSAAVNVSKSGCRDHAASRRRPSRPTAAFDEIVPESRIQWRHGVTQSLASSFWERTPSESPVIFLDVEKTIKAAQASWSNVVRLFTMRDRFWVGIVPGIPFFAMLAVPNRRVSRI
jgi:hypothetical protein